MKKLSSAIAVVLLLVACVWGFNFATLGMPLRKVIEDDPRNQEIAVRVHYKEWVAPGTLVFDLRDISGEKSMTDVFRVLLQFARAKQSTQFDRVELAFRGETKFILEGDYFKTLGDEYESQNPIYTMRTFAEHVYTPAGEHAFGTWTGGMLGVLGKQLEDFNAFHHQWYLGDLGASLQGT